MKPINPKTLYEIITKAEAPLEKILEIIWEEAQLPEIILEENSGDFLSKALAAANPDKTNMRPTQSVLDKVRVESRLAVLSGNNVYIIMPEKKARKKLLFVKRGGYITDLAVHNGRLYDSGTYGVYDTLEGRQIADAFGVDHLISFGGRLYHFGPDGVYDTFSGERLLDCKGGQVDFIVNNNKLYLKSLLLAGDFKSSNSKLYTVIFDVFNDKKVAQFNGALNQCISHNGVIYAALANLVYDALNNKKVAERKGPVSSLVSHRGVLYDCVPQDGVYDTLNSKKVLSSGKFGIGTRLVSHNGRLYCDAPSENYCKHALYDVFSSQKMAERKTRFDLVSVGGKLYDIEQGFNLKSRIYDTFNDTTGVAPLCCFRQGVRKMIIIPPLWKTLDNLRQG
jgi:hypothetical protein